ncbi:glycosyl hydrolase family 95 catalytic domain-containing protein [Lacibacter sp.]|uniref:glycosyl hydrolase family 95 catalytic domain-containing protein n=1 Tax=Lacibacter sp. TaxID=1915409 RepID=UPI002B4AAED0|nr:hypothetical protein [Lacibacter sp.]HLP38195.1 hypothetical protein [Lacibacter sp.]
MKKKQLIHFCFLFLPYVVTAQMLSWNFPVNRTHAGILLGNGVQGLMVWGDSTLNITIGRAGFWDHRGGNDFAARANFDTVKSLVSQNNETALRNLFTYVPPNGQPARPQHYGGGVLKIKLPTGYRLKEGLINLSNGQINIHIKTPAKKVITLFISQAVFEEIAWIDLPVELHGKVKSELIPMWEWNKKPLQQVGITAPVAWNQNNLNGFLQILPADKPLAIGQKITPSRIIVSTNVGSNAKQTVIQQLQTTDINKNKQRSVDWWKQYWNEVARISIPDTLLQEVYDYGLYKQACSTPPHGIACTLQGAFMEEYQTPPWSNDYHFNINEQLIYTPALATNRTQHFKPLLQLLDTLMPVFKRNGQLFFKNPNAIMFPHAVDDRGQAIGNYWGGTIDHATTAWVAYLTWQYWQYSGDSSWLHRLTYPLLQGAFEGFWSMLEKTTTKDGRYVYSLPVSVSPEYGGGLEGVGRNSSFQLAALHKVLRVLPQAAVLLNLPNDSRWADVQAHLPLYTTIQTPYGESSKKAPVRIALWEGKDLEISHRHHSHLGGIYPFQTIDLSDTANSKIIENSYWHWVHHGAGGWTGWCVPWASIIHNRMGHTDAAISWLHYWWQNFVNEGRGTLHNTTNLGMAIMNEPPWARDIAKGKRNTEIMQLDAGFGAVSAILDMLVQETVNGIYIMPNRSWRWKNLSFKRIRTAGGFLIGASVRKDKIERITVQCQSDGQLKLYHGLGIEFKLNGILKEGECLEINVSKGTTLLLEPK